VIPLLGFAPDLDPTTPGVITDCDGIIPTLKGFRAIGSGVSAGLPALAAACQSIVVVKKLDDTSRIIAGTKTKLYEGATTSWTDVSAGGGSYAGTADGRWRFAQFGNVTLAAQKSDPLQSSISGAFAAIAGAPSASLVETINEFVMVADYNDGTDTPDGWFCSGLADYTNWTPSASSQAANGRLTRTPGRNLALRRLGDDAIIYKERSMYRGVYQGPPVIWAWELVSDSIGCSSQEGVINIGTAHFFIGYEDFYMFDGSRPVPIGSAVKEWFFDDLNFSFRYKIHGLHDRNRGIVMWWYPSTASTGGALDKWVAYNYRKDRWGRGTLTVEALVEYMGASITFDSLGSLYATYDDLPDIAFDSPFWVGSTPLPAYVDSSHVLKTFSGVPAASSYTTGDIGVDDSITFMSRVRPRFTTVPTTASMTNYYRDQLGAALTTDATRSASNGKFDLLRSARWHRMKFDFTGDVEVIGNVVTVEADSDE
jgi:hypothetical protein